MQYTPLEFRQSFNQDSYVHLQQLQQITHYIILYKFLSFGAGQSRAPLLQEN